MNEVKRKSSLAGLIVLFLALTPIGVVLSYFYIMFQVNAHDIWANIIANFAVGLILAAVVWVIKRMMRITNDAMSLVVVVISLAITMFVMWNMWFGLMVEVLYLHREVAALADMGSILSATRANIVGENELSFIGQLQYFNERGTWSLNGYQWYGLRLSAVWAGEMLVLVAFSLMVAYASVGLYLEEKGAWVKEKLMNYGFSAFDDNELDQLASGDIEVVLAKPLETQGEAMNAIAVCYHKGEPTEFIALYKAGWDRDGSLTKGRHIMTVKLGIDKIDVLDTSLQAIHYPSPTDKVPPGGSPEDSAQDAEADIQATGEANQETPALNGIADVKPAAQDNEL
ncbi:MAG: hypothetical protein FWC92_08920 [Defluviitaleaceae bacterium]|nr:hypothetical protein [Defluviitaleaceae bacterium]